MRQSVFVVQFVFLKVEYITLAVNAPRAYMVARHISVGYAIF